MLKKTEQDNLFWYLIVPILVGVTLIISLSPWVFELLATPVYQVFSGINRWSTDYFIYLSYVEQGKRGFLAAKLLHTTMPHTALYAYLSYTLPGYIFGHLFGFSSIFIYHFFRAFYGLIFLIAVIIFFYKISGSKTITAIAFFLTFYVHGFAKITSLIPFQASRHLAWLQEQNIIGRATSPLHYSTGFVVFIIAVLYFFYSQAPWLKKAVIFGILLNLLLLTNPFNYLIMGISLGIYFIIILIKESADTCFESRHGGTKNTVSSFLSKLRVPVVAFLFSFPILLYLNHYLTTVPWGVVADSPKFYVITTPPTTLTETALSIGPVFFLGIIGAILKLVGSREKGVTGNRNEIGEIGNISRNSSPPTPNSFLLIWPTIQIILFLYGDYFKIHPPRVLSGLYYLPFSLFSAYLIVYLSIKIQNFLRKRRCLFRTFKEPTEQERGEGVFLNVRNTVLSFLLVILFIITFPNYYLSYKETLFAFTDFKYFAPLSFPTQKQMAAFQYLEKNVPMGAGVMAMFEAQNQIIGYAGNATEMGMSYPDQVAFFTNKLSPADAYQLLKKYYFQYVYFGYQEQFYGGNMEAYPFLKKIYQNEEVRIYKIQA